jgi:Carboxypeptidase regulatory-like domain
MFAVDRRALRARIVFFWLLTALAASASAQSVASGTIEGTVADATGAVIAGATVVIYNPISGYQQTTSTDSNGQFRTGNVPFNRYHVTANYTGFAQQARDVEIRSAVPVKANFNLKPGPASVSVTVEASSEDLIENVPNAHSDVDISRLSKLPITAPGSGLAEQITMTAPGVVADSNGFYHPLGDHAETSFGIDGQPVNDQQSKVFSTQLPPNAIQSLELINGFPGAEYGEKTSLVVNATTRSGLGLGRPHGSLVTQYGSFGTVGEEADIGGGSKKFGYFLALNGSRSGRFLDTPEFLPIHDIGNNGSLFSRFDVQPNANNAFHLDLFGARNWFQIPNTFDQPNQDQRQRVLSFNLAPGYQHTFSTHTLLTVNSWLRQDQVNYFPSANIFDDTPVTVSQLRKLLNFGGKTEVSYSRGKHNLKLGAQLMQTRLSERFALGITDPTNPTLVDPDTGLLPPGLVPLDLTAGGSLFRFNDTGNINEYAAYITDAISWGQFTFNPGLRVTRYDGLTEATGVQPRFGISYLIKRTGTVLRGSYARTLETPHNENLLLSSATGGQGLIDVFGAVGDQPIQAGRRNQFNLGFQQTFGRYLQVDADYFWKFTRNAAEFDVLLNTPITFPIMWRKDKLDGFGIRVSALNLAGFRVNTTMGRGRLRYFGPEVGGLIFNAPLANVFRTDSDDAFYQTTNVRYQWKKNGPWAAFTWRYDNGQVSEGGTLEDVLGFTADQQAAMGFFCGTEVATPTHKITSCDLPFPQFGATRVRMPAPGSLDDDRNPARVASRNLFDVGLGTDNLLMTEKKRVTLQFTVANLTNKVAFYNFLSTFGGTHFVQPRSYQAKVGFVF